MHFVGVETASAGDFRTSEAYNEASAVYKRVSRLCNSVSHSSDAEVVREAALKRSRSRRITFKNRKSYRCAQIHQNDDGSASVSGLGGLEFGRFKFLLWCESLIKLLLIHP